MGAGFDPLPARCRELLNPLGPLIGKEFAKKRPGAEAGVIVAAPPEGLARVLVVSKFWTVQRQFHEPVEADRPLAGDLLADNLLQVANGTAWGWRSVSL